MYDADNVEFKFSPLRRHLNCDRFTKGEVNGVCIEWTHKMDQRKSFVFPRPTEKTS